MAVAKSGWVYRLSSFLKKWKKSWLVLFQNGDLKYYESDTSSAAEDTILMRRDCLSLKIGTECKNVTPPDHLSSDYLFMVVCRNDKSWQFCGDSLDDMKAWQLALEQARVTDTRADFVHAYPPMPLQQQSYSSMSVGPTSVRYVYPDMYPRQQQYVYYNYGAHPAPYVVSGVPGQTTVIYQNRPYSRYGSSDMAFGMLAGAAMGTMLWGPCLWW